MLKKMAALTYLSLFCTQLLASSPAATQNWVTNYVRSVVGVSETQVANWDDSGYSTFFVDGTMYRYKVNVVQEANTEDAVCVYSSNLPFVSAGTIYAKDNAKSCYRNAYANPNRFNISSFLRHNGTNETVLAYTNVVTSESYDSHQISDGNWMISYVTNGTYISSFNLKSVKISKSYARLVGVTNAPFALSTMSFSSANDESVSAAVQTSISVDVQSEVDGVAYHSCVTFDYPLGSYYAVSYWPDPDEDHYYDPSSWPTEGQWYTESNWIGGRESVTYDSYYKDPNTGLVKSVPVTVPIEKFLRRRSLTIPPYVAPVIKKHDKTICERKGHVWENCKCSVSGCGKTRPHNLEFVKANECAKCTNYNGTDDNPGKMCGSHYYMGGDEKTKSDISFHVGWHDGDVILYNKGGCKCKCGMHMIEHIVGKAKEGIAPGIYSTDEHGIIEDSENEGHHFFYRCIREKTEGGDTCNAPVVENESHHWKEEPGREAFWVKLVEGEYVPTSVESEADKTVHGASNMKCEDCGYVSNGVTEHTFPIGGGEEGISLCTCTACNLVVHKGTSWKCGSVDIPGCSRCLTRDGEPIDFASHDEQKIHFYEAAYISETTHRCSCGRVYGVHFDDDEDGYCDACGYKMADEEEKEPEPRNKPYPVSGCCGNWTLSDGTASIGGRYVVGNITNYYPTSHKFGWPETGCMVCTNYNPTTHALCNSNSPYASDHGFFSDKGGMCVCSCGAITNKHQTAEGRPKTPYEWMAIVEEEYDKFGVLNIVTNCYQKRICARVSGAPNDNTGCTAVTSNKVDHSPKYLNQWVQVPNGTETNCGRVVMCDHKAGGAYTGMCGYRYIELDAHSMVDDHAEPDVVNGVTNMITHILHRKCSHGTGFGCGYETVTNANHNWGSLVVAKTPTHHMAYRECVGVMSCGAKNYDDGAHWERHSGQETISYKFAGLAHHTKSNMCDKSWCNTPYLVVYDDGSPVYFGCEDRNENWYESPDCTNGLDRGICSLCGGTNYYSHTWVAEDENNHYCANYGNIAKRYPHEYKTGSDICIYCLYDRSAPIPVQRENCSDGCGCWRDMLNGRIIASNCSFPDTWENGKCGCTSCQSGSGSLCICETIRDMFCLGEYPTVSANKFKNAFIGCGYRWVNGDDPVYHVCASGFEDAFQNSLSLAKVTFNALTNCEANAFKGAFVGCTNLTTVQFSALRKAGANAFAGAFVNCGPIDKMVFPELTDAADGTFDDAFVDVSNDPTEIVEFRAPKMKNHKAIGGGSFHHYGINDKLKIIDLRALEVAPLALDNSNASVEYLYFNNVTNTWNGEPIIPNMVAADCKLEELHLDSSSRFWRDADPTCTTIIDRDSVTLPWWTMIFVPSAHYYNYIHTGYYDRIFSNFYPARGSDEFIYTKFGTAEKYSAGYDIVVTCRCDVAGLTVDKFWATDSLALRHYSIFEFSEIRPKWYKMKVSGVEYNDPFYMRHDSEQGWVNDEWTHTETAP